METAAFSNQLSEARTHACSGEYKTSIVYYEGVLEQLTRHMRTVNDPFASSKWQDAKKRLLTEVELVKDLYKEVQTIGGAAGPGPGSMGQRFGGEVRQGMENLIMRGCNAQRCVPAWPHGSGT